MPLCHFSCSWTQNDDLFSFRMPSSDVWASSLLRLVASHSMGKKHGRKLTDAEQAEISEGGYISMCSSSFMRIDARYCNGVCDLF